MSVMTVDDLIQAISELNFIDESNPCEILKSFETSQHSNNSKIKQDFDPKVFSVALRAKAVKINKSAKNFQVDIMTMAIIGTMQGSNIDKIISKSSIKMQKFLKRIKLEYGILGKNPRNNKDITLHRVATLLAKEISRGLAKGILDIPTTVDPDDVAPGFPKCMAIATFGTLIPLINGQISVELHELLVDAFSYHQKLFNSAVNPKSNSMLDLEIIFKYVMKQVHSNFYSNDQRIKHCLDCNIVEHESSGQIVLLSTVKKSIETAAEKWRLLFRK